MNRNENFQSKQAEKKPSKDDIAKFTKFLKYLADEIAEGFIERSPSPCSITKRLVSNDAQIELCIELGEREPINDEPYFNEISDLDPKILGIELCLSEVESMPYSEEYDYMLISHMVSIENGRIAYSIVHYLINEIEDVSVKIDNPEGPNHKITRTWSKEEQSAQKALVNSEPKITKDRLEYIINKTREVVDSNSS